MKSGLAISINLMDCFASACGGMVSQWYSSTMNAKYAIETIGLTKKYPTRRDDSGGLYGRHSSTDSFVAIFDVLRNRKRSYIEALRGIDLQIRKGEIFGLLGPNGAGKTTLIKILCTLVIHDEGEAYVNGFDVKKEPGNVVKHLQAVLPESRGFNWRLTGKQNLQFYSLLYGIPEKAARERVNYLLELTGLKDRANDGYQQYSTGMQRKLLLCRALLRNTPVLLFDEPTAGLDPTAAAEFRSLVRDKLARQEGTTVMLSTHNLNEAQDICDRIAILDRGKIIACDTPGKIQYAVHDEKVFSIAFADGRFDEERGRQMLNALEAIQGVHGATPDVDTARNLRGLSLRVDKDTDLSDILSVIMKNDLKISSINTTEPSLEEAFMAITRRRGE
ncbi:MAG: ABC transporter ATP-binding protein [Chloroflexi bacterium]|nr:ABC transporter ATP-binding protein [Chloroflexota bacterium]